MNRLFVDTSFYIAVASRSGQQAEAALQFIASYRGQFVTTDFVLVEFANHFSASRHRPIFFTVLEQLRSSPQSTIVPASSDWMSRGINLHRQRADKDWSLTDCISFCVMQDMDLSTAATFDHHFRQAGFATVPEM